MNEPALHAAIPGAIVHKLGLVRRRKMLVQVASATVAALAVLLAAMGVAMLIDWLATLYDSRWRFVLTMAALSAAAVTTAGWLIIAWQRGLRWQRVAGDVERQFPLLEERWSTMTQLRPEDAANPDLVHPAMLRRVATEAARWEPHVEPEQVVSLSPLSRTMIALTAMTAVLALAVLLDARQTFVLMRRFWLPGSSISATELVDVPGNIVIGRGEPLALGAAVRGTPVERAVLYLRDDQDAERSIALVAHGQEPIQFAHRLRSVEEPFAYRFRAGDGQTEWYSVDVADRPEIDKLEMQVTPPSYTGRPRKSFDKLPPRVAAIEHSELELALRPTMAVESVELSMGKDKSVRLAADADGWYRWKTELTEGFTIAPLLTESHGLTNRRVPKCQFSVYPDRPPAVKVLTPDDQMEVRPDDTVQITFSAQDDVGIGSAEMLIYDEAALEAGDQPVPIATIPIPLEEQAGARSVQKSVDLDLRTLGFEDGSELSYEIRVREDRGGSPQEQVATTQPPASPSPDQLAQSSPSRPATSMGNSTATTAAGGQQQSSATPQASQSSSAASSGQSASPNAPNSQSTAASPPSSQTPSGTSPQPTTSTGSEPRVASRDPARTDQVPSRDAERAATDSSPRVASRDATQTRSASPPPTPPPAASREPGAAPPSETGLAQADRPSSSKSPSSPTATSTEPTNAPLGRPSDAPRDHENRMAANPANAPARSAATPESGRENMPSGSPEPGPARTASSDRRAISSRRQNADQPAESGANPSESQQASSDPAASQMANNPPNPQTPPNNRSNTASNAGDGKSRNEPQTGQRQQSPSASQTASTSGKSSPSSPSDSPPGDAMARRSLDVPQESSSKRMKLKVDEWAGSFEGQQRAKLELAIAPELDALDKALARAERTARGVIDDLGAGGQWQGRHDRDVSTAEKSTVEGQQVITRLEERSKDTPYAFIGLQVADIGLAHVNPARSGLWKSLQSEGGDRLGSVRDAAQHLARAREMVAELKGQFERAKKEFQLAESVERVKKMYRVYLENSQALLRTQQDDPNRYNRKMVEFDLDEEYLARLREVMEMRRDLQAELARILADDPRLLRRFMDSLKNRTRSLREDLSQLVAGQEDLNREVRAWTLVEEADRPKIAKILKMRQAQDAGNIATAAGELQSRYQAWLPLNRKSQDADLAAASKKIQQVATTASELQACCQSYITAAQRPAIAAAPAGSDAASGSTAGDDAAPPPAAADDMAPMLTKGQQLYSELTGLEVSLRQLAARDADSAGFAANRLVETRRLIADTSAWVRQMRAHESGNYPRAAEVDQYRLAMKTDELAGKLGQIEQSLAALMQRADGSVPKPIAEKARQFLTTLDKQASPNQLAGVYALHSNQMPRAVERQRSAGDALTRAEKQYDELIQMAIKELDKLPVQDPIAQLLDDPTLDELLAELEQESPIRELLGVPLRPSNLQIVDDWLNRGGDNALAAGGGRSMMMNQFRQDQQRMQRRLDQAYRRAIARALKEAKPKSPIVIPRPVTLSDWNQLVSKLGDDLRQGRDKAPPEQYRRAIEQYFAQISNVVAEQENQEE